MMRTEHLTLSTQFPPCPLASRVKATVLKFVLPLQVNFCMAPTVATIVWPFSRLMKTRGDLTAVSTQTTYGKNPRNFAIDPSGTFLLAANQDSSNIVTFRINQATGYLKFVEQKADVPRPVCLKMIVLN